MPGLRSRGELVLEALDHADAVDAAEALSHLDPNSYRSFNLIVVDERDGFWLRHDGGNHIEVHPLKEGLSLIAAGDVDDLATRRLAARDAGVSRLAAAGPRPAGLERLGAAPRQQSRAARRTGNRGDAVSDGRLRHSVERADRPAGARRARAASGFPLRVMVAAGNRVAGCQPCLTRAHAALSRQAQQLYPVTFDMVGGDRDESPRPRYP